jgi:hypothetical protein
MRIILRSLNSCLSSVFTVINAWQFNAIDNNDDDANNNDNNSNNNVNLTVCVDRILAQIPAR